jgi:uncharacterized membrane protein YkvI
VAVVTVTVLVAAAVPHVVVMDATTLIVGVVVLVVMVTVVTNHTNEVERSLRRMMERKMENKKICLNILIFFVLKSSLRNNNFVFVGK